MVCVCEKCTFEFKFCMRALDVRVCENEMDICIHVQHCESTVIFAGKC